LCDAKVLCLTVHFLCISINKKFIVHFMKFSTYTLALKIGYN
jgi:hypothetical protein